VILITGPEQSGKTYLTDRFMMENLKSGAGYLNWHIDSYKNLIKRFNYQ